MGLVGLVLISKPLFAENYSHFVTSTIRYPISDTIYYLHDTILVQKNNFPMKAYNGLFGRLFVIKCNCLSIGNGNIYLQSLKKKVIIDEQKMKSLKLITLSDLINFVKANNTPNFGDETFGKNHLVYVLEPSKPGYILHRVYNSSIDYETVE